MKRKRPFKFVMHTQHCTETHSYSTYAEAYKRFKLFSSPYPHILLVLNTEPCVKHFLLYHCNDQRFESSHKAQLIDKLTKQYSLFR